MPPILPKRDIAVGDTQIRLVEARGQPARYATLTYLWDWVQIGGLRPLWPLTKRDWMRYFMGNCHALGISYLR